MIEKVRNHPRYVLIASAFTGFASGIGSAFITVFYATSIGFGNYVLVSSLAAIILLLFYGKLFSFALKSHGKTAAFMYSTTFALSLLSAVTMNKYIVTLSAFYMSIGYVKAFFEFDNFFYVNTKFTNTGNRLKYYMAPKIAGIALALYLSLPPRTYVVIASVLYIIAALILSLDSVPHTRPKRELRFKLSSLELVYIASFLSFFLASFATPVLFYEHYGSRGTAAAALITPLYVAFVLPKIIDRVTTWKKVSILSLLSLVGLFIPSILMKGLFYLLLTNTVIFSIRHVVLSKAKNTSPLSSEYFSRILSYFFLIPFKVFHVANPVIFAWTAFVPLLFIPVLLMRNKPE